MLLQAGGDPLLKAVWDVLKDEAPEGSSVKQFSVIRTYWDQNHGWCGAGGDRKGDPRTREAVVRTIPDPLTTRFMARAAQLLSL